MTDGIIQEVCKKYRQGPPYHLDNGVDVYSKVDIGRLEQELIEKIKHSILCIEEINEGKWQKRDIRDFIHTIGIMI